MALKPLTIAGGGIAGLALGIALRRRLVPVRILEAGAYPRHRVCGEFISGIQPEELKALGMDITLNMAATPRETVWFDGARPMLRATMPETAYGLSRHVLDEALAERFVAAGGELCAQTRFTGDASQEGLVLANGRPQRASPWLGLKAHFTELDLSADLEVHLANAAYVGLTRVEHGHVNVSGLFRRNGPATGGPQVLSQAVEEAGLPQLALRLRGARMVAASLKGVNRFYLGWQTHRDDTVRIGDAAVMIPPITGNGMTMAMQGALSAAEPLAAWSRGEMPWRVAGASVAREQRRMFGSRLRWARFLQWMLLKASGRRICSGLIAVGCVSFETLYRKVR